MSGRVVMLLSNDAASDPRVEKEAHALVDAGWAVTILAWDRGGEQPTTEDRGGVRIERLGPRAVYGSGLRNLTGFREFWRNAGQRARQLEPDVVHCHDLDTAPAGLRAVRDRAGTRLVLDFHELYRETKPIPRGRLSGPIARGLVDVLERRALRRADLVMVANPANLERYTSRVGTRAITIENAPDADLFAPAPGPRPERPFTVCYVGQKRYLAPLKTLVDIAERDERLAAILAGGGIASEELAVYAAGRPRVELAGRLRYEEIPAYYGRSDAVYAVYDSTVGNARRALFVKGLEGMACGLPVLTNDGIWFGDYVIEHGIGLTCDGADPSSVEAALLRLAGDPTEAAAMGRRGRAIIEAGLNWQSVSARLVEAYAALGVPDGRVGRKGESA